MPGTGDGLPISGCHTAKRRPIKLRRMGSIMLARYPRRSQTVEWTRRQALVFCLVVGWLVRPVSIAQSPIPAEPPEPQATLAVQKILDEAGQRLKTKRASEALTAGDRALAA